MYIWLVFPTVHRSEMLICDVEDWWAEPVLEWMTGGFCEVFVNRWWSSKFLTSSPESCTTHPLSCSQAISGSKI